MVVAPRWTGLEAAALRRASRMSIRSYAAHLGVSAATVANWDSRGELARLNTETQQLLDIDLERAPNGVRERFTAALAGKNRADIDVNPLVDPVDRSTESAAKSGSKPTDADVVSASDEIEIHVGSGFHRVEAVRQELIDALREGSLAGASLDDWDLTVVRHGRATRDRPYVFSLRLPVRAATVRW